MKERYAFVKFRPYSGEYVYKCDKSVKKGYIVLVPVSGYSELQEVVVSKIKYLEDKELPVSKDKIKLVSDVIRKKDKYGKFKENLNKRYAFKEDKKVNKNWKKQKRDIDFDMQGLPYKYTLIHRLDKNTKFTIFSKGKNAIIECDIGDEEDSLWISEEIVCSSKQELKYVLHMLMTILDNYIVNDDWDILYIRKFLAYPNDRSGYIIWLKQIL